MKKILLMAAVILVLAAAGFGGGYLSEAAGQGARETVSEAPVLPDPLKTDEQVGYTLPERTVSETVPLRKEGTWIPQEDGGYRYTNAKGDNLSGGWEEIDDAWYYFDNDGRMATGWLNLNGVYYYLDSDGRMRTGWVKDNLDGLWYYLNEDGSLLTNAQTPDGNYVNSKGSLYYNG